MLAYLKKFNNLPAELREKVSNRKAITVIEELEKKYRLPLASLVMKVMVKEIVLKDLASALFKENLTEIAAGQLAEELKEKIFFSLADYLSPPAPFASPAPPELQQGGQGEPERKSALLAQAAPTKAFKPLAQAARPSERSSVRGASFFFSPDDEQEIRELTDKIDLAEKTELPVAKIEEKLEAIINRVQINFGSADLADRFKQILKTYLRGIRNKLETELTLIKPFSNGGLSFDQSSAQKVMTMADKIVYPVKSGEAGAKLFNGVNFKSGLPDHPASPSQGGRGEQADWLAGQAGETVELSPQARITESDQSVKNKPLVDRDAPYDFSKLTREKKAIDSTEPRAKTDWPKIEDVSHELAPLTPALTVVKPPSAVFSQVKSSLLNKSENKVSAPVQPAVAPVRQTETMAKPGGESGLPPDRLPDRQDRPSDSTSQLPLIRRRFEAENLNRNQKVKVEDVKYIPRVMSPLDEIRYLDLINFRRLDKDPQRAIDKIKTKINLLEEEGYSKRMEAIKLWRSSPLNGLYLAIGRLSISGNKPVDVIIEERKSKVSDYLTVAEFEAIMDLNKSLRF